MRTSRWTLFAKRSDVHVGLSAQGGLQIVPIVNPSSLPWRPVPVHGVSLTQRMSPRAWHWLTADVGAGVVQWAPGNGHPVVAYLRVPDGRGAWLLHMSARHPLGIGGGTYALKRGGAHAAHFEAYQGLSTHSRAPWDQN